MRVGFVIITYNISIDIFLLQIAAIKKFCKDPFTIHIFDNSTDLDKAEHVRYHSEQLGLDYCKTFSSSKNSSDSHAFAANFAYQRVKDVYDILVFWDHDCVPLISFSPIEILSGGHIMAGIGQGAKKKYLWPGILFIHSTAVDKSLVDFSPNAQYGLDSGGNLYKVIEKYGEESCIFFNEAYYQNPYFNSPQYGTYTMINNGMFCHIVNSSNWFGADRHEERMNSMVNLIREKTGIND